MDRSGKNACAPAPAVPDSLCLMPWIHAHVSAQGFRKLCCIDTDWKRETAATHSQTLGEFWNSPEVRQVRLDMLEGRLPERCGNCSTSPSRSVTYKDEILARWPDAVEKVLNGTAPDGSIDFLPFTFDYRSSNCNLRCRTCGPHSSTSAEIEARASETLGQLEGIAAWDAPYLERRERSLLQARDELIEAARAGRIRHLYWAGGEPLMDETHWQVMGALIDSGEARHVDVAYNTNLTVFAYRGRKIEDVWPRFKSAYVQVSVDGLGAAGEYIRTGFRTPIFIDHLDRLLALSADHPGVTAVLDLTLTSVGLLHLGELLEFALQRDIDVTAKLMIPRRINGYMAVEFLPSEVRDDWCRHWIDFIDTHDSRGRLGTVRSTLEIAMQRSNSGDEPDYGDADHAFFRRVVDAYEEKRRDRGMLRSLFSVDGRLAELLA